MILIEGLQIVLAVVVMLLLGYRLILSVSAYFETEVEHFATIKNRKFAVILLARSDENILARSLYSLSGVVYPKNMYDLIVIADNFSDQSAQIAEKLGAIVLTTDQGQLHNKGFDFSRIFEQVLNWDEHRQYEAVVLFNTDSLVAGNYLEVMNYYLEKGGRVIRGNLRILPDQNNLKKEVAQIDTLLNDIIISIGSHKLGCQTIFKSNGACFSTELLRKFTWENFSDISDFELGIILQLDGYNIDFAPEASFFTEAVTRENTDRDRSENISQKETRKQVRHFYLNKLLATVFSERSLHFVPVVIHDLLPRTDKILNFVVVMIVISLLGWTTGLLSPLYFGIWMVIAGIGIMFTYTSLAAAGIEKRFIKSIRYLPLNVFYSVADIWQMMMHKLKKNPVGKSEKDGTDLPPKNKEEFVQ